MVIVIVISSLLAKLGALGLVVDDSRALPRTRFGVLRVHIEIPLELIGGKVDPRQHWSIAGRLGGHPLVATLLLFPGIMGRTDGQLIELQAVYVVRGLHWETVVTVWSTIADNVQALD